MYDFILICPRSLRAKRFWTYIRRTERAPERNSDIKDQNRMIIPKNHMEIQLTEVLRATRADGIRTGDSRLENPITHFSITPSDVEEAMERVWHSASGLDGIPGRMIKQISRENCEFAPPPPAEPGYATESNTHEKPNSVKGNILTYRPIKQFRH